MRARGARPAERRGKVLFINADAEYHAGRAQNYLRPEHVEKIVSTFEAFAGVPGYAAVVSRDDLGANDWNLNIRRYADNAPPPELQDVRAHLLGGVPKSEVEGKHDLFAAHGLDPHDVFVQRDGQYLDFSPAFVERAQIKVALEADAGMLAQEARLRDAFGAWWEMHEPFLCELPRTGRLMALRAELLDFFAQALAPEGLLDRFKVDGVIASWWNESQYDLRTLAAQGFEGLVDGWVATIRAALEEGAEAHNGARFNPLDHKLVVRLLPEYLDELSAAEAAKVEMESRLEAGKKGDGEEDDEAEPENGDGEELSEAELKALKRDLAQARKTFQTLQKQFAACLGQASAALTDEQCRRLVLDVARDDLAGHLERYVAAHRQQVIAAVENWWDKYRVTLCDVEAARDAAAARLADYIARLGYRA